MSKEEVTTAPPEAVEENAPGLDALVDALISDAVPKQEPEAKEEVTPEVEKAGNQEPESDSSEAESAEDAEATEEVAEDTPEPVEEEATTDDGEENVGFKKRIDKLTSQKYELKDALDDSMRRITELEKQVAKRSKERTPGDIESLIDDVASVEELETIEQDALSELRWARKVQRKLNRDPDGAEAEVKKRFGDKVSDVESFVDELVYNAETAKDFSIPKARKRLEQKVEWDKYSTQLYPWLEDSSHQATNIVDQTLRDYGDMRLKDIPNAKLTLARAIKGYEQEQLAAKAANAPKKKPAKKKPEPTPQPSITSSSPDIKAESETSAADKAAEAVRNGGGDKAFEEYIAAALLKSMPHYE